VSIFGSDLGFCNETKADGPLQEELGGVRVYVANLSAYLLYVDINFIVPGNQKPAVVPVRVVRQGVTGPEAPITLVTAAPQLFATQDSYVIARLSRMSERSHCRICNRLWQDFAESGSGRNSTVCGLHDQ
jgi:uncharacterized protein (TIGR03437 family)